MVANHQQGTHDDATARIYYCLFGLFFLAPFKFVDDSNGMSIRTTWYSKKETNFSDPFARYSLFYFNYIQCHEYFLVGTANRIVCRMIIAGSCNKSWFVPMYFKFQRFVAVLVQPLSCIIHLWKLDRIPTSFPFGWFWAQMRFGNKTLCILKVEEKINSFGLMPNHIR